MPKAIAYRRRMTMPTIDWLVSRIEIMPNACWEWRNIAGKPNKRRPVVKIRGKQQYLSRWVYEEFVGPLKGLIVCHKCDNGSCINPEHLFLGTYKDNTQDAISKGRMWQLYDKEIHAKVGKQLRWRKAWNTGKPMPYKTKQKLRKANLGKKRTEAQRLNYSKGARLRERQLKRRGFIRKIDQHGRFTR